MKKIQTLLMLPLLAFALTTTSCTKDDGGGSEEETSSYHYDLWVSLDGSADSAMGSSGATLLINSYESLEDLGDVLNFENDGADVSSKLYNQTLYKGGYYYQIPQDADRFGKYKIENDMLTIVKEFKLPDGAVLAAKYYCGDWIDDDTLVIMGTINSKHDIAWLKINTTDMTLISSGTLDLDKTSIEWTDTAKSYTLSTSGLVGYRSSDDRLIYSYSVKRRATEDATSDTSMDVSVAFIDPSDMSIKTTVTDSRVEQTYGTAWGELEQNTTFFTDGGDYYICCRNSTNVSEVNTYESGFIRIKAGETKVDPLYLGLFSLDEKVCTAEYLGGDEVLVYAQNLMLTGAEDTWSSSTELSCYYSIWNVADNTRSQIQYNGSNLPYCTGNLTTQIFTVADGKAYIGVVSGDYTGIYIYDIAEKSTTKGATIATGYTLERVLAHEKEASEDAE
ncbi:MAG: hypothetical protein SNG14_08635 [Rikenellaceae bacterium]